MADVNFLPDPCSLPDAQKKRALNEKERLLYAPMAGVGRLVYDKDAVYIDLPANHVNQQQVCVCFTFEASDKEKKRNVLYSVIYIHQHKVFLKF